MVVEWWGVTPFLAMLLAIALCPVLAVTAPYWESRRVQLAVALALGLPVAAWMWAGGESAAVVHTVWEYTQFVVLLFSLYVISGGIALTGNIQATPRTNTAMLAAGALLASFIGTTGAAMLLIRPLLSTNRERVHRVHTVLYAIVVVANCGGLLTPLGDPPLFLGMLRGVPFSWTLGLLPQWLFVNGLLLFCYHRTDMRLHADEPVCAKARDRDDVTPLRLRGSINLIWLATVVLAVALLPSMDLSAVEDGSARAVELLPWRELTMLAAAALSYGLTDRGTRYIRNQFTWSPIAEVAVLFFGIFLTMMPALKFLSQIAPRLPLNAMSFFLFTGSLSAVLDNAPTYATFFEIARQLPGEPRVADVPETSLVAISLGAVLCGALTYIGNGPNFMVRSVAQADGVPMPSFARYVQWSVGHLGPVLIAMALIFIASHTWAAVAGWLLTAAIVARATWQSPTARSRMLPDGAAESAHSASARRRRTRPASGR